MTKERNGWYQQQQPARPKSCNIMSIYYSSKSTIRKINLELTINDVVTEIIDADTDHHAKGKSKTATISKGDTKFAATVNFSMLKGFGFIFFVLLSIFFIHR